MMPESGSAHAHAFKELRGSVLPPMIVQGVLPPEGTLPFDFTTATGVKLGTSVAVFVALWIVRRVFLRFLGKRQLAPETRYRWAKSSGYALFVLGALVIASIWLDGLRQMGTFLGLLTAGVTIALRDLVASLAGWAFILLRRPFELGDRIQIGDHHGDVVDIRIFQFSLLEIGNWVESDQSTGRVIHVPNLEIFTKPSANYTTEFPFLWHEVPVLVTFDSDWRRAKTVLEEIAREYSSATSKKAQDYLHRARGRLLISYTNLASIVYTSVEESGVLLTIRCLVEPRHRRGVSESIWEAILDGIEAEPEISLAYPTLSVHAVNPRDPTDE